MTLENDNKLQSVNDIERNLIFKLSKTSAYVAKHKKILHCFYCGYKMDFADRNISLRDLGGLKVSFWECSECGLKVNDARSYSLTSVKYHIEYHEAWLKQSLHYNEKYGMDVDASNTVNKSVRINELTELLVKKHKYYTDEMKTEYVLAGLM